MKIDMLNSKGCFFPSSKRKKKSSKVTFLFYCLARQSAFHSVPSEIPGRFVGN